MVANVLGVPVVGGTLFRKGMPGSVPVVGRTLFRKMMPGSYVLVVPVVVERKLTV